MLLNRKKKNKARINSSFVETTIYRVIFNISQKEKKKQNKITYCKYKINSNL